MISPYTNVAVDDYSVNLAEVDLSGSMQINATLGISGSLKAYLGGIIMNGGSVTFNGGFLQNTFVTGQGMFKNAGTLTGDIVDLENTTFNNAGTFTVSGCSIISTTFNNNAGTFSVSGCSVINSSVHNAGTWNSDGMGVVNSVFDNSGGSGTLLSATGGLSGSGTYNVRVGDGFDANSVLTNEGTVHIGDPSGQSDIVLLLAGGGSSSGTFQVDDGATFEISANVFTFTGTAVLAGPGDVVVDKVGVFDTEVENTLTPDNFTLTDFAALQGSKSLIVKKSFTWSGASDMKGTGSTVLLANSTMNITGNDKKTMDQRKLQILNGAAVNWQGGELGLENTAKVYVQSGGTFNIQVDNQRITTATNGAISVSGQFVRADGLPGTTVVQAELDNQSDSGGVQVRSGTLELQGSGTQSSNFVIYDQAKLVFSNMRTSDSPPQFTENTQTFEFGTVFEGPQGSMNDGWVILGTAAIWVLPPTDESGQVQSTSCYVNFGMADTAGQFGDRTGVIQGQQLGGGVFVTYKRCDWVDGVIQLNDTLVNRGLMNVVGTGTETIDKAAVDNYGTVKWIGFQSPVSTQMLGGISFLRTAKFFNYGLFDMQCDGSMLNSDMTLQGKAFVNDVSDQGNQGQFSKSYYYSGDNKSLATIAIPFWNTGGEVHFHGNDLTFSALENSFVQTTGATFLESGSISTASGLDIEGGVLSGPGSISGNAEISGVLDLGPGPGVLSIDGNFTVTSSGTVKIKLGGPSPGSQYDQIAYSGQATLETGCTLVVSLLPGYQPSINDPPFDIITGPTLSGTFTNIVQNFTSNLTLVDMYDLPGHVRLRFV